jgi:hypothetical protein
LGHVLLYTPRTKILFSLSEAHLQFFSNKTLSSKAVATIVAISNRI